MKKTLALFFLFLFSVSVAGAQEQILQERDRDPRTFCPYEGGVSKEHLLIFIDVTDGISEQQLSLIRNNILTRKLFEDVSIYGRVSLVVMDGNKPVTALEPLLTVCRPKSGRLTAEDERDHFDIMAENRQRVDIEYRVGYLRRLQEGIIRIVEEKASGHNRDGQTPLMEAINEISRSSAIDFGGRYEKKTLIFVSNLYHNSRSIPLNKLCVRRVYRHEFLSSRYTKTWSCPSFSDIKKKRANRFYLDSKIRPRFTGSVDVKLWVLHKEINSGSIRDESLISFWREYFKYVGGDVNLLEPEFEADPY